MSTFTVAAARDDFSRILNLVAGGNSITVVRYGKPVAKIVPVEKGDKTRKDWGKIVKKYAGMWSGPDYEWADEIGRPSRYFRDRNFWK